MKILFLNQVFYPDTVATAQHTADLALYLKSRGHDVTVLASRRAYEDPKKVFPAEEDYRGIKVVRVRSFGFGKKSFVHRVLDSLSLETFLLLRLFRLPKQDVVISFTSPPLIGFIGMIFVRLKGGRLVQWLMDLNPDAAIAIGYLRKRAMVTRLLVWIFRVTLEQSYRLIVLDRWMKRTIENYGIDSERIVVVPPWPVQEIRPPSRDAVAESEFRLEHGLGKKFVILYAGNHSIVHPLSTLLDAARRLRDSDDVVFLFVGAGLRAGEVDAARDNEGLKNVMHLPRQPREKLESMLGAADLHVVIMGNEVAGLVHASKIYGVLATGKPYVSISPAQSHLTDLLKENPYGFHLEHGDTEGVVNLIGQVKSLNEDRLTEYRENNVNYVIRNFTAEKLLASFYSQVIEPLEEDTRKEATPLLRTGA